MTERVLIAMSGGVDSSVAAALLLDRGYAVEGVTMKLSAGVCCDIASAMAVCERLGIGHRVIDAQELFSREIVDYFISEYAAGRTPNPCIRCNELVKFSVLLEFARSQAFDFLATGHYARIERAREGRRYRLLTGADPAKDQSYFLYRLDHDQLSRTLFPLGDLRKSEVRALARARDLPAADRPESQEVCFIPGDNYRAFLREHAPQLLAPGEIVLTDGTVVGRHEGIAFFTVGQRRKLGVAAGERLYVIAIDPDTKRVVLGRKTDLEVSTIIVTDARFPEAEPQDTPLAVGAKIRYRAPLAPATIEPAGRDTLRVRFEKPVAGAAPGQACVFYDGERVVGGGVISTFPPSGEG